MSCVNANTTVDIELCDFEKDHLIHTYRILKNLGHNMWDENLDEFDEYYHVMAARDTLEQVLKDAGIDVMKEY